ncbi:MAG: polC 1 [Anaerosporomusa subterranea]|jgi:DNA polymerase-3 subunit alpha (Gram-positive type)|nr:polC 1 [Anaerosporomusa subterranea]
MNNYCIIPESQRDFQLFTADMLLAASDRSLLDQCVITKVTVNPNRNTWLLSINTPQPLPNTLQTALCRHLAKNCQLASVSLDIQVIDLSACVRDHWTKIVAGAIDSSALHHVLIQASRRLAEEVLYIETDGELAAQMLIERGAEQRIRDYLNREFSACCTVKIIAACREEAVCEDIFTPEYLEALSAASTEAKQEKASPILYGRNIKEEPRTIESITEEDRNLVIQGEIVKVDCRELKTGRFLVSFDIADDTNGISAKLFLEKQEQYTKLLGTLKSGMIVRLKGKAQQDKFANNDLSFFVDSIMTIEKAATSRFDDYEHKRVELHAHTRMSALDAIVPAKQLVATAAKWGHPAIAITDHGVVQAFPEAYEEAAKHGIKLIYGVEGYLFDEDINQARHIIILAKDRTGLYNLYRLISISHLKYLHRTPRIPRSILVEHREGLLLGSACEAGELIQAILRGADDDELLAIASFYDYLEIQPIDNNAFLLRNGKIANREGLQAINHKICELGQKLDKLVVATCDVHFLNPEDEVYRRILMSGQGYSDADNQPPLFFRTTREMLAEFQYLGEKKALEVVVENSCKISDSIESFKPIPDELYSPQIPGAEEEIRSMSYQRAEELYGNPLPDIVAERLQTELNSIINNGFAVLYLIAHKLVKKSLDDGYLVGSRGSVGSSFVATMTEITEVNPLPPHWLCPKCKHSQFVTDGSIGGGFDLADKNCPDCQSPMAKNGHDIPFAVFLGFEGDKVPDIDLNFSGDYQPVAHKYTEELFGKDNVFRAGTIATIADKTAFGYVKNYFIEKGAGGVRNSFVERWMGGCTGVKRTTGQHPGGIMVVPRDMDIHYFTPIQYPADDKNSSTITTHFDYHSISSRLVKLDILGHDDPTVIRMLEDLTHIDAKTIPFDDPKTMSLFSSTKALGLSPEQLNSTVGTFGIPEFGTKFVRQMLEDTKPSTFSELVRISGFSHGTDVWLNNAQSLIKSGTAKLSEAISARDDIMIYLIHKGVPPKLAFKVMESVRKGKGVKPEDCAKLREKNVPEWYIDSCQKIKYMFPKAHAVAYVMMAFRIAYCKVNHPLAFYASYFTVRATDFDADLIVGASESFLRAKLKEFEQKGNSLTAKEKSQLTILEMALEMNLRGFRFHKIDIYQSDSERFLLCDDGLLPPIGSLQGVGVSAAHNLVQSRQDKLFSSVEDLRVRSRVSKTVIEMLEKHGCLDGLPPTDQMLLFA